MKPRLLSPMKYHWLKDIKSPEDFPPNSRYRQLAETIGVENTLKVLETFEGESFHVGKLQVIFRDLWQNKLRSEWRKYNAVQLAHKYDITVRQVQNIVNDHEDQFDLFPCP